MPNTSHPFHALCIYPSCVSMDLRKPIAEADIPSHWEVSFILHFCCASVSKIEKAPHVTWVWNAPNLLHKNPCLASCAVQTTSYNGGMIIFKFSFWNQQRNVDIPNRWHWYQEQTSQNLWLGQKVTHRLIPKLLFFWSTHCYMYS